jgi:hypothetical protein
MFHTKTETELSLRSVVFQIRDRALDKVQDCDSYIYETNLSFA